MGAMRGTTQLTPEAQAAYDASVQQLVDQAFAIPGVQDAVLKKAQQEFMDKWAAPMALGGVAVLLLGIGIGRATK